MKRLKTILGLVCLPITMMSAIAAPMPQTAKQPIYTITINVVDRTTKAINYQHRDGSTTIDFKGTPLMAAARGEAKVESKQGYMEVEVEFDNLQPATRFGPELLTYVLWAISAKACDPALKELCLRSALFGESCFPKTRGRPEMLQA